MQNVLIFIKMFIISCTTGQQKLIYHLKFLELTKSMFFGKKNPFKFLNTTVVLDTMLVRTEKNTYMHVETY